MEKKGADFRPFKSWRYNLEQVSLEKVIAPPYDVISGAQRDALYERSPYNVVRLILGREPDFYDQAAGRWKTWSKEGVLAQDPHPSIYLYEQTFNHPFTGKTHTRLALLGVLKLEEPGAVFGHENTFAGPKKDRLSLIEKVKTNLSPIFGLYTDPKKTTAELWSASKTKPALFDVKDDQGITHRAWAIEDKDDQEKLRQILSREKILIADGHHRYETALEYKKQMQKSKPSSGEAGYDFVMMALVASGDDGLLVLPTHRVIQSLAPLSGREFVERLQKYFDLAPLPGEKLFEMLEAQPAQEKYFGLSLGSGGSFLMRLKNLSEIRSHLPKGKPDIWYEIEVNLLSHFIFDVLWGVSEEKRLGVIEYTHFHNEAIEWVESGKAEAAFLLRSPEVDTVRELAYAGAQLPQKTTYFYPKLASGLFFYHHE